MEESVGEGTLRALEIKRTHKERSAIWSKWKYFVKFSMFSRTLIITRALRERNVYLRMAVTK